MQWFVARLVFRIVCGEGLHTPQFDEQVRLIQAADYRQALHTATSFGLQENQSFFNITRQLVQWQFINVAELTCIGHPENGMEIASGIKEVDRAEDYIALVNTKAAALQEHHQTLILA
jgi:enoyl reductase-like protein